jgi:hypothetical protein
MRCANELANSLSIHLDTSLPVFISFKNVKFMKQLEGVNAKITPLITVMQLDISSKPPGSSSKKVRGRFVVIF